MAGNKVTNKSKGKEDKNKSNKSICPSTEDSEDLDFAILRKPIPTSITGFAQARKIFDFATEELKDLLTNECDLLYECKVCRNIFRSLANFISHKRVYCKEKFSSSIHGHFINSTCTANEILKIKNTEQGYQDSLKGINGIESVETEDDDRVPITKDLTSVVESITKTKGVLDNKGTQQVVLQKIPSSSVAVFQNMSYNNEKQDKMRSQVNELDQILSRDKAVLQSDGKFAIVSSKQPEKNIGPDNVIQISDDDDNDAGDILKCKICDLQFSTQKTLRFHMKYKHLESRLVYPCPDCLEIFSTSWSVYRHLFKVHRKTAAQIRRLRESIQAKAFRMNNPPAFYEKRKNNMKPVPAQKITEEERLDQENQAWMDNMEADGEVPRCGGCGRTFERRAALAAHTHTCQPRSRALARRPEGKKIEIQIRKDYNKPPSGIKIIKATDSFEPITIQTPQSASKVVENDTPSEDTVRPVDDGPMDVDDEDQKSNESAESPEKVEDPQADVRIPIRLPHALQAEKSNLAAFKQRIQADIVFVKLICKKCEVKCESTIKLYEHMADHYKWMRYACKLCNFKHYDFDKLPEHVKVVHKLKGDSDFYFSTVKAIDGTEAMIISRCLVEPQTTEEVNETNEISPDSRRQSRCSSDSSRLSDDSSSSSTLKETSTRKRRQHLNKNNAKRKKEEDGDTQRDGDISIDKVLKAIIGDNNNTSNIKAFEDNSSDMDDIEEKSTKRNINEDKSSVASRRPVRKKTKPKYEDFEYDLSNLLKMEAQGYRDSQTVAYSKSNLTKKKSSQENSSNYEIINKDYCGALVTLSKKAVHIAAAQMKTAGFISYGVQKNLPGNVFVKPLIPKTTSRGDKASPKKDDIADLKDSSSNKIPNPVSDKESNKFDNQSKSIDVIKTPDKDDNTVAVKHECKTPDKTEINLDSENDNNHTTDSVKTTIKTEDTFSSKDQNSASTGADKVKSNINVIPLKFRRQSLELMKNPLINKNITDFTKAGMKTKILVIKPINRNKDGTRSLNTPLKFQTIKLKDSNKSTSSSEDLQTDQVVVVKVPKVSCTLSELTTTSTDSTPILSVNAKNDIECLDSEIANSVIESKEEAPDNVSSIVIKKSTLDSTSVTANESVSGAVNRETDNQIDKCENFERNT